MILATAVATGVVYHLAVDGNAGSIDSYLAIGGIVALSYVLPFLFREEFTINSFLAGHRELSRTFIVWNTAFLSLGIISFLTKPTEVISGYHIVLFYAAGLLALATFGVLTRSILASLIASGRITASRIMLVGSDADVRRFQSDFLTNPQGGSVVATWVLPHREGGEVYDTNKSLPRHVVEEAVEEARALDVEEVVLLVEWSRNDVIHDFVEAFKMTPVAVHLGAPALLGTFADARLSRLSAVTALSLTAPPLGPMQSFAKRSFDVIIASLALVLFSPLFLVIALAIRLTSPGPIFFRQRRRGYNSKEFRIWKFRTMTTLDDGVLIEQARREDTRFTWIGRHLRRTNLDELPQLINVVRGEMSLVGPRPHALAHDVYYEERIASYPRRLNVKPGITGWAQVNGFRGPTEADDAMRARVEYDLYYIDNWSILFDFYILALTVLSPKAFRNAF